jgi:hypothetical protein
VRALLPKVQVGGCSTGGNMPSAASGVALRWLRNAAPATPAAGAAEAAAAAGVVAPAAPAPELLLRLRVRDAGQSDALVFTCGGAMSTLAAPAAPTPSGPAGAAAVVASNSDAS